MKKREEKNPSVDQCQPVTCNHVQVGWRAFGQLLAPFTSKIKKKKQTPKWPAPRRSCKMHRALPSLNDITFRILLCKGKTLLGTTNILLVEGGGGRRRLKGAEGCCLCLKTRCVFQTVKHFVEIGKEGKSICVSEAFTLKLWTLNYPELACSSPSCPHNITVCIFTTET